MTKKHHLLLASGALLAFGLSPSWAGPCTDQIAEIQKTMSSMDAGSGPTMGARPGQNPTTTSSTTATAGGSGGPASAAAGSATVPNVSGNPAQTPRAGEAPKTDATVAMNTASQGRATSAQDVRCSFGGCGEHAGNDLGGRSGHPDPCVLDHGKAAQSPPRQKPRPTPRGVPKRSTAARRTPVRCSSSSNGSRIQSARP